MDTEDTPMNTFNEQFEKYLGMQKELFAPAQAISGVMMETFERLARHNYVVLGDYVNYAVQQAKLPAEVESVNDLFGRHVESSRSFGEKMVQRAQEYVEIVRNEQTKAEEIMAANEPVAKKAVKKAA